MNKWIVITGGPSSGKTTTINILKNKGYKTNEESARKYYEEELKRGRSIAEIKADPTGKQEAIARLQMSIENSLYPQEQIFFDRAIPDLLAYYKFDKLVIPDYYHKAYKSSYYSRVFFLERLSMINDGIRNESDEEAEVLSSNIFLSYSSLGLDIVRVPVMPQEDRVNYILEHTKID